MGVTHTPQIFLIYRQNVAQEIRFLFDSKEDRAQFDDLLKSAVFFHSIAKEEEYLTTLISESKEKIETKEFGLAITLLEEANKFDKWKELYGSTILSNLAYIQAMKGNSVLARHYLKEYNEIYGDVIYDIEDNQKIQAA